MNNNEEGSDERDKPIDTSLSGRHILDVSTGKVANNPLDPYNPPERKPTNQSIVISPDNKYLIDAHTGDVAENPLDINDPVKRDNVAVMQRKTTIWLAHVLVIWVAANISYSQLGCTPPRDFVCPAEIWGIIVGIYAGSSTNVINKILAVKASLGKRKQ